MPFAKKRREPQPQTDEAMRALPSDKQRAFVMHYVALGAKHGAARSSRARGRLRHSFDPRDCHGPLWPSAAARCLVNRAYS